MSNPPDINWNDMSQVQAEITRWAQEKFPHRTDHHAIHKLMVEEIPEMAMHKKEHGTGTIGTELADCFILLFDLASLWKVDMAHAIFEKMQINYARQWAQDENGIMQHVSTQDDSAATVTPIKDMRCPSCNAEEVTHTQDPDFLYQCLLCSRKFNHDCPF